MHQGVATHCTQFEGFGVLFGLLVVLNGFLNFFIGLPQKLVGEGHLHVEVAAWGPLGCDVPVVGLLGPVALAVEFEFDKLAAVRGHDPVEFGLCGGPAAQLHFGLEVLQVLEGRRNLQVGVRAFVGLHAVQLHIDAVAIGLCLQIHIIHLHEIS